MGRDCWQGLCIDALPDKTDKPQRVNNQHIDQLDTRVEQRVDWDKGNLNKGLTQSRGGRGDEPGGQS